jgi:hypothetical protein
MVWMQTLYYLTALQQFVFGIGYLKSATICASSNSCATLNCIEFTTIILVIYYCSAIVCSAFVEVPTFPGWDAISEAPDEYDYWYWNVYNPLTRGILYLWIVFSMASAAITVYSIY